MVKKANKKKQVVGYTSGVFDMFHVGHLNVLMRSKALCDKLIVGVTTDELVSYKDTKAIIPFKDRCDIIQNIKCVDMVVPQDHLDKYEMWKKLKFDIMFIGDDWYNTKRFKDFEKKLSKVGVEIIYLPYTKNISTTMLKRVIEFEPSLTLDKPDKSSDHNMVRKMACVFNFKQILILLNEKMTKKFRLFRDENKFKSGYYSALYKKVDRNKKQFILALQSGRGGMKWICDIFSAHKNARGGGERNRTAESFFRYINYNKLPVDVSGIYEITKREVIKDWGKVDISLVSSPYFSHNFLSTYKELKPDKVIWAINDPEFTITSFYNKGWYFHDYIRDDVFLASGFQPHLEFEWSHMFGRLIPTGEFYTEWKKLTRVGKIAWFLNETSLEIFKSIKKIPKEKLWIFKLEEANQNYDYYREMAAHFGLQPLLTRKKFLSLKKKTSRKAENAPRVWSKKEQEEFEKYASNYIDLYNKLKRKSLFPL